MIKDYYHFETLAQLSVITFAIGILITFSVLKYLRNKSDFKNFQNHKKLAYTYFQSQDYDMCLESVIYALSIYEDYTLFEILGEIYHKRGRFDLEANSYLCSTFSLRDCGDEFNMETARLYYKCSLAFLNNHSYIMAYQKIKLGISWLKKLKTSNELLVLFYSVELISLNLINSDKPTLKEFEIDFIPNERIKEISNWIINSCNDKTILNIVKMFNESKYCQEISNSYITQLINHQTLNRFEVLFKPGSVPILKK